MIFIVNVSTEASPLGLNDYELRINEQLICRFVHMRSDSLATCLRAAADSYDEHLVNETIRIALK